MFFWAPVYLFYANRKYVPLKKKTTLPKPNKRLSPKRIVLSLDAFVTFICFVFSYLTFFWLLWQSVSKTGAKIFAIFFNSLNYGWCRLSRLFYFRAPLHIFVWWKGSAILLWDWRLVVNLSLNWSISNRGKTKPLQWRITSFRIPSDGWTAWTISLACLVGSESSFLFINRKIRDMSMSSPSDSALFLRSEWDPKILTFEPEPPEQLRTALDSKCMQAFTSSPVSLLSTEKKIEDLSCNVSPFRLWFEFLQQDDFFNVYFLNSYFWFLCSLAVWLWVDSLHWTDVWTYTYLLALTFFKTF